MSPNLDRKIIELNITRKHNHLVDTEISRFIHICAIWHFDCYYCNYIQLRLNICKH